MYKILQQNHEKSVARKRSQTDESRLLHLFERRISMRIKFILIPRWLIGTSKDRHNRLIKIMV